MKAEARILVSKCSGEMCFSYIVRGRGVDGALLAPDCELICKKAIERGFYGELRFYFGDCSCGLKESPRIGGAVKSYHDLAGWVVAEITKMRNLMAG
ncbi:MAG: hypothetical protein F7B20_02085 [Aeropyrum sp.]|nr:hypothetical protein [Aeropyrum sp.]MCE4616146.1 hypothetical protein [Aeropyrum sp.]